VTGEAGVAAGGKQKGGKNFQESGFTGAVGAKEGDGFAIVNGERDSRECGDGGLFERLKEGAPAAAGRREILL
jgi:hypothetical protein